MINLDQVRTLEWKVKQAVQLIVHLRRENDTLRGRLSDTEVRLQELESLLESFKASQNELESGIRSALEELDNLEASPAPVPEAPQAVSYPPEPEVQDEPEASPASFTEDEPSALFEKSPAFASEDPAQTQVSEADLAFEEEFAALAAQEEAAAASTVPDSVELEAEPEASEAEAPHVEEKKPEQPGLGIF